MVRTVNDRGDDPSKDPLHEEKGEADTPEQKTETGPELTETGHMLVR